MNQQQYYPFPVYQVPQPPANQGCKTAAIMLFVAGFCLKVLGVFTLAIFIGFIPLGLGAICDLIAFIFLCLI